MSKKLEITKRKLLYRASYRGTKEMDIMMLSFVKSIINDLNDIELKYLDRLVNLDDEKLISIKNGESKSNIKDTIMINIINKFIEFNL